jgi:predicted permease
MDRFRLNLTLALRRLRSSPGFALAALATLALGIGANATIFAAVNALLFRSLAVERPNELVTVNTRTAKEEYPVQSIPNYKDLRDRNNVLAGLAGYRPQPANLAQGDGNNARIWTYEVTGNYFDLLGVSALRGRVLHPEDDGARGGHPVVVITYQFWQRRFGGDPAIVGRKIKINGLDYDVAGVTPERFIGTEMIFTPDLFVPLAMVKQIEGSDHWMDDRGSSNTFLIGRLKPGVTTVAAETGLGAVMADLAREYPAQNAGMRIVLSRPGLFGNMMRGTVETFAAVLMGVAGLALLIACSNLASLLLARAADRRRDTAIRLALGAGRRDLISQLLTESLLLSLAGGAAGVLLAVWLTDRFAVWRPPVDVPVIPQISVDWHVVLFTAAASIFTGVLFGLAPALQSVRVDLAPALKNEAISERLRRFSLRDVLVTGQIALSVVLLIGSLLMVRSLQRALTLNLGFEPRGAAVAEFDLRLEGYDTPRGKDFQRRLLERVRNAPGIESAGMATTIPLTLNWNSDAIFVEGRPEPKASDVPQATMFTIDPGYLAVMRTRLIAGRNFDDHDRQDSPGAVIVNQAFASQILQGENPIGKRIRLGMNQGQWHEIVGLVEDGKYRSLGEHPMPAVFRCFDQHWDSHTVVLARSSLPEAQVTSILRRLLLDLDPNVTIQSSGSLTDQLGIVLLPARIAAMVLGAFGLLAIVLAGTGLYGIMAYAVARRTREIGIRMALGARQGSVLGLVMMRTGVLVGIGTAAGVALSLIAARAFSQIVYGVSATDPLTYSVAILLMATIAAVACLVPARRAIALNPVTALRME